MGPIGGRRGERIIEECVVGWDCSSQAAVEMATESEKRAERFILFGGVNFDSFVSFCINLFVCMLIVLFCGDQSKRKVDLPAFQRAFQIRTATIHGREQGGCDCERLRYGCRTAIQRL